MFIVMRLLKKLELENGQAVDAAGMQGCLGMLAVFESRKAAEEIYGEGVDLIECAEGKPDEQ